MIVKLKDFINFLPGEKGRPSRRHIFYLRGAKIILGIHNTTVKWFSYCAEPPVQEHEVRTLIEDRIQDLQKELKDLKKIRKHFN